MRATIMYGAGDVRIENVPDARIIEPTDAVLRITHSAFYAGWPNAWAVFAVAMEVYGDAGDD